MYIQRLFEKKGGGGIDNLDYIEGTELSLLFRVSNKDEIGKKKSLEWNLNSGGYLFGSVNCTVTIYKSLHLNP